jgi:methionyl-tRNA formyltransferase
MNILFMGTPDFAEQSLSYLVQSKHKVIGVVTTEDKPHGRGMKLQPTPVKRYALEHDIPVYQPERIKENEEFIHTIKELNPDIICVASYGKILPKELIEIPKYGCINVHPSMLPKYRGATPIQTAIMNGDKTTGVTIMHIVEKLDAGDIILQKEVDILEDETTGELWERLSVIGAELLVQATQQIENGTAKRIPQGENYTVTKMIKKEDARIDWETQTGTQIKNITRAFTPFLGMYSNLNGKKIKIWNVNVGEDRPCQDYKNRYNYKNRQQRDTC